MFYYRMEHEPESVYITDIPCNIPGTIEISEEDYHELLMQRSERDISEEIMNMIPSNRTSSEY